MQSDEERKIAQSKSLPPLNRAKRCVGTEKDHGERRNGWPRTIQNFGESGGGSELKIKSLHETSKHLGQRNYTSNARNVKRRVIQKRSKENSEGAKLSRINEGKSAKEWVGSHTIQSSEYKAVCLTAAEEGGRTEQSMVKQHPCKDIPVKSHRTSDCSFLNTVPGAKEDTNDVPRPKGSTRKPSIGIDCPKSRYILQSRQIGNQNLKTTTKGEICT